MKKANLLSVSVAFAIVIGLTVIGLVPTPSVSADSGTCGMRLTWDLRESGMLVISGTGDMDEFTYSVAPPWRKYGNNVKKVVFEDGVTTIGRSAFSGLSGITSVTMSDTVTTIGESAFNGCIGLTSFDTGDGVERIRESAFWGCTKLKEFVFGNAVTTINNNAFRNCLALESVTIPDSVTGIGYSAFQGCTGIRKLVLGSGVEIIEMYTFNGCTALESVTFSDSLHTIDNYGFFRCESLKEVDFSENLTRLHRYSFSETGLTKVVIRGHITRIGVGAFSDNPYLTEVHFTQKETPDDFVNNKVFDGSPNVTLYVPIGASTNYRRFYVPVVQIDEPGATTTEEQTTTPDSATTPDSPSTTTAHDETTTPTTTATDPPKPVYKLGRILDIEEEPSIFDALEVLKYLVRMDGAIKTGEVVNQNALYAALITAKSQEKSEPSVFDALEILKKLVGMDNLIDSPVKS